MKSKILISLSLIILIVLVALFSACDGGISFKGYAYEWTNATKYSTGKIYIVQPPDIVAEGDSVDYGERETAIINGIMEIIREDIVMAPLEGASIEVGDEEGIETKGDGGYYHAASSDADGYFDYWRVTRPEKLEDTIKVSKPGYKAVTIEIPSYWERDYIIVAILVPDNE